jgi:O-antigen/teichoic acid export membrane protein
VDPDPLEAKIAGVQPEDRRSYSWDIRKAPVNYLALLVSHAFTAVFSFAAVWAITRSGGAAAYGGVVAFIAASQLVQIFLNWSLTALLRFGVEEFVETGKITKTFWTRSWIWAVNLIVALAAAVFWLDVLAGAFRIPPEAKWLVLLHIAFSSLWMHFQYALQAVKMIRLQGYLLAIEKAIILAAIIALLYVERFDPVSLLMCFLLPPVVMSIAAAFLVRNYVRFEGMFSGDHVKTVVRFSLPLIPFAIISYLATSQLDALFITQFLSTRDLGIYSIATQINGTLLQLPILMNALLMPMFVSIKTSGDETMLRRIFADLVPSVTLLWSIALVSAATAGVYIIPRVFGTEYEASAAAFWVLASASALTFPILFGMATLSNTYSRTYISMYASALAAATNIVLNIVLIPRYGMIGCAWASVIASFASLATFKLLLDRAGLLPSNWIFVSVIPVLLSSIILTVSMSVGMSVLAFLGPAIAIFFWYTKSLKAAREMIKRRFLDA